MNSSASLNQYFTPGGESVEPPIELSAIAAPTEALEPTTTVISSFR